MAKSIHHIFQKIQNIEPSPHLESSILRAVSNLQATRLKRKIIFSYFGLVSSLGVFLYTAWIFGIPFLESDFFSMLSLIFSDMRIVLSYWNEFSVSLLETFPTTQVIALLTSIFFFMLSARYFVRLNQNHHYKIKALL